MGQEPCDMSKTYSKPVFRQRTFHHQGPPTRTQRRKEVPAETGERFQGRMEVSSGPRLWSMRSKRRRGGGAPSSAVEIQLGTRDGSSSPVHSGSFFFLLHSLHPWFFSVLFPSSAFPFSLHLTNLRNGFLRQGSAQDVARNSCATPWV